MRTKHGYGNKAAGIGNTGSGWIASTKVILFKEMFEFLVRYHGSANKARTEIDIKSKDFVYKMNNKKLNGADAKKILDAYNKLQ